MVMTYVSPTMSVFDGSKFTLQLKMIAHLSCMHTHLFETHSYIGEYGFPTTIGSLLAAVLAAATMLPVPTDNYYY